MNQLPSLREMLDAGVHFGHKTSRWHPKMAPYIYISKSGVHVINLEETEAKLKEAVEFISREASEGKTFIFVGTKKQSGEIVKEAAVEAGMPYVNVRWLGGTITNFEAIKSAVKNFQKQKEELEKNNDLPKSELSKLRKEVARGEKFLGGLVGMDRKPDALILFGSYDEKIALREAKGINIPVVAVVDTNADPNAVEYPIPANDDATKSVKLIADTFARAIKEAKAKSAKVAETK
ncbi:MAG: 30S ribosomal protein S2 [Patescibacteria group bacterium]